MSRLDSFIRRMMAQRDILNHVAPLVRLRPGPILEVGLGNGRTYDHLRELLPGRRIFVFDRTVRAHPDCIPPREMLFLGEAKDTLVEAYALLGRSAVLIHCDLGTGDAAANAAMAPWLAPRLAALLADGGLAVVNQPLDIPVWRQLPPPASVPRDRYYLYMSAGAAKPNVAMRRSPGPRRSEVASGVQICKDELPVEREDGAIPPVEDAGRVEGGCS